MKSQYFIFFNISLYLCDFQYNNTEKMLINTFIYVHLYYLLIMLLKCFLRSQQN
jgi:hypothetical protein